MPVNGDSLSKIWTLGDAVQRALTRLKISKPTENYIPKFIKEINIAQQVLAKKAKEDPAVKSLYEQPAIITFNSGECTYSSIEATKPLILEFVCLNYYGDGRLLGTISPLSSGEYPTNADNEFYTNGFVITVRGRRLRLFTGTAVNVSLYTFEFVYIREVNELINEADNLDIPDIYFEDLVKALEQIFIPQETIPETKK
jgi:hypothetical protein